MEPMLCAAIGTAKPSGLCSRRLKSWVSHEPAIICVVNSWLNAWNKMNLPVIEAMKLSRIAAPFDNPDFVFELKYDGFRSLAYIADGRCSLVSRHKTYYQSSIPSKLP